MRSKLPYPGSPIIDESYFVNHEEVLFELHKMIDEGTHCVLIGGRGMGKTSILRRLKSEYETSATVDCLYLPVYCQIDKQASLVELLSIIGHTMLIGLRDLVRDIAKKMGGPASLETWATNRLLNRTSSDVVSDFEFIGSETVLTLHVLNAEYMGQASRRPRVPILVDGLNLLLPETKRELVRYWEELPSRGTWSEYTTIVASDLPTAEDLVGRAWRTIPLKVFAKEDVARIAALHLQDPDISVEYIDQIDYYSSGFPYVAHSMVYWTRVPGSSFSAKDTYERHCHVGHVTHYNSCADFVLGDRLVKGIVSELLSHDEHDLKSLRESLQEQAGYKEHCYQLHQYLAILVAYGIVIAAGVGSSITYRVNRGVYRDEFISRLIHETTVHFSSLLTLSGEQKDNLATILENCFTADDLQQLVAYTFDRRLDTISALSNNLSRIVFDLVQWAENSGQTALLVRSALEKRGRNVELLTLAKSLGISPVSEMPA